MWTLSPRNNFIEIAKNKCNMYLNLKYGYRFIFFKGNIYKMTLISKNKRFHQGC